MDTRMVRDADHQTVDTTVLPHDELYAEVMAGYHTPDQRHGLYPALDKQVGGDHYKKYAIQPVEFIMANGIPFCEGNIIKYVSRWRDKAGVQDLKKARHYLDMLIEQANAVQSK